jgi:hypothetical protein
MVPGVYTCILYQPSTSQFIDKLRSLCKGAMETFLRQNEVLCNTNAEIEKQGQNLIADELVTVL